MAKEAVSKGEWSMEGTDSAVIARNKKQSRPRVPFASLPRSRKQHRHRAKHCEGRKEEGGTARCNGGTSRGTSGRTLIQDKWDALRNEREREGERERELTCIAKEVRTKIEIFR